VETIYMCQIENVGWIQFCFCVKIFVPWFFTYTIFIILRLLLQPI